MTLIYLLGIAIAALLVILWVEFVPTLQSGSAARFYEESHSTAPPRPKGWRGLVARLNPLAGRWAPQGLVRKTSADLYFANLVEKWLGWDPVHFTSLRLALGLLALVFGLLTYESLLLSVLAGWIGWQAPAMLLARDARRVRRRFQGQLPEFIQLIAAQMAAGVSLEEAIRRVAQTESVVARWMRGVLQMAQGRSTLLQLQREAQQSGLAELVSLGVQLEFVRQGVAQQELMQHMAERIASEFVAGAEQRAERVGAELVIPMVLFYFLPFVVIILTLIGWPILTTL